MASLDALRHFVVEITKLISEVGEESYITSAAKPLLAELIAKDDWLPEDCARPHPDYYQQYLLHADPLERFSLVSFVWGPGQKTPVHDHRVWGLLGILRGAELSTYYSKAEDGSLQASKEVRLEPRHIDTLSPQNRDIHAIRNAFDDRVSISIHLYGANIGAVCRAVYDPLTGTEKPFVSGYSNTRIPNLWDRSASMRDAVDKNTAAGTGLATNILPETHAVPDMRSING